MLERRGGHRHGSSASPERDLLLGFQFPRRPRASALRASVLGSLGLPHGSCSVLCFLCRRCVRGDQVLRLSLLVPWSPGLLLETAPAPPAEYEENAHGEQDHGEHQSPDPQTLVIWEGETQGSFLLGSGKGVAPLLALACSLTVIKGILLLLLLGGHVCHGCWHQQGAQEDECCLHGC